jgi:DNA-binding Lrp family transcriptional regulator
VAFSFLESVGLQMTIKYEWIITPLYLNRSLTLLLLGEFMEKAFVCVSSEPSSVPSVFQKIKEVEGVEEVEMVYGVYDVCFKVKGETIDGLKKIINERIRRMDNVRNTLSTILVNSQ